MISFHRARDEFANCKQTGIGSGYINTMKFIIHKLPNIMDDEFLDQFVRGLHPSIQKKAPKQNANTFVKTYHFAERRSCLEALIQNLHHSQYIH